jgi:hypothetical protein
VGVQAFAANAAACVGAAGAAGVGVLGLWGVEFKHHPLQLWAVATCRCKDAGDRV